MPELIINISISHKPDSDILKVKHFHSEIHTELWKGKHAQRNRKQYSILLIIFYIFVTFQKLYCTTNEVILTLLKMSCRYLPFEKGREYTTIIYRLISVTAMRKNTITPALLKLLHLSRNDLPTNHLIDLAMATQITKFMGPTWGPSGSCRPQMGPMLAQEPCYQGKYPTYFSLTRKLTSLTHSMQPIQVLYW